MVISTGHVGADSQSQPSSCQSEFSMTYHSVDKLVAAIRFYPPTIPINYCVSYAVSKSILFVLFTMFVLHEVGGLHCPHSFCVNNYYSALSLWLIALAIFYGEKYFPYINNQ